MLLPGDLRIHDEAIVDGAGGALARRTVTVVGATSVEQRLDRFAERLLRPGERDSLRRRAGALRRALCRAITSGRDGWTSCRWRDSALVVERRYAAGRSPFSSGGAGQVSFALHHFLAQPTTRPEFPLIGLGPVMRDDPEHRAFIADLVAHGHQHTLTVRMPGRIWWRWGERVADGGHAATVDLPAPWPETRESFIISDSDPLHAPWFIALAPGLVVAWGLWRLRALRRTR
uniref:Uncharacterized protein n=1 Tax=Eiseniibacteriota bacterium TaxID=2212470 RepID=A0A832MM93_UNCEI